MRLEYGPAVWSLARQFNYVCLGFTSDSQLDLLSVRLFDVPLCAYVALEQQDLHVGWVLQAPLEYKLLIISEKINVLRVFFSHSVYSLGPFANPRGNINFKKS